MAQVHFGFGQILKATPTIVGRIRDSINFFITGFVVFLPDIATEWDMSVKKLAVIVGVTGLAINSLAKMFGAPISGKTVPAEDVTEMKTDGLDADKITPSHKDGD